MATSSNLTKQVLARPVRCEVGVNVRDAEPPKISITNEKPTEKEQRKNSVSLGFYNKPIEELTAKTKKKASSYPSPARKTSCQTSKPKFYP